MTEDENPIQAPATHSGRAIARSAAETAVELLPGGSLLTRIFSITHPSLEQQSRESWEEKITEKSNDHDAAIKSLIASFLKMKMISHHADEAQKLEFLREGMYPILEEICESGLREDLAKKLREKFDQSAPEINDIISGLKEADKKITEVNSDFANQLKFLIDYPFGKIHIRGEIFFLLNSKQRDNLSAEELVEYQKEQAQAIIRAIDRFNRGISKLYSYAIRSIEI